MSLKTINFSFSRDSQGFIPEEARLNGVQKSFLPKQAQLGMALIFSKLQEKNAEIYARASHLKKFTIHLTPIPDSPNFSLQIVSDKLIINAQLSPATRSLLLSSIETQPPKLLLSNSRGTVSTHPPSDSNFKKFGLFLISIFSAVTGCLSRRKPSSVKNLQPAAPIVPSCDPTKNPELIPKEKNPAEQDKHPSPPQSPSKPFPDTVKPDASTKYLFYDAESNFPTSSDEDREFFDAPEYFEPQAPDAPLKPEKTVEPKLQDPLAGKIFSDLKKVEIIRKLLQELQERDSVKKTEAQYSIKLLIDRLGQLLNSNDPLVERFLDHILEERETLLASSDLSRKMNQFYLDANGILIHLAVKELHGKVQDAEAKLEKAKRAFNRATESLSIRLKDLRGYIQPSRQPLLDLKHNRPALEAKIREEQKDLAMLEELIPIRTLAEKKAKLDACVAQLAGEPYFQDLLKFMKTVDSLYALLEQIKNAYMVQKPYLITKLRSYTSIHTEMEKILPLLPQRAARQFAFLMGDLLLSGITRILPEFIVAKLPDYRQGCAQEIEKCRRSIENNQASLKEIQIREKQSQILQTIDRDLQELETLLTESPESKEAITKLEEQEYPLTGMMLIQSRRFFGVPPDHPIDRLLGQLGRVEFIEADNGLYKAKSLLAEKRRILADHIRLFPSVKTLLE